MLRIVKCFGYTCGDFFLINIFARNVFVFLFAGFFFFQQYVPWNDVKAMVKGIIIYKLGKIWEESEEGIV